MTDRCSRCGGGLDPRSGACVSCASTGFDPRALAVAPLAGGLLGALLALETRIAAVVWLGLASLAAFAMLIRAREKAPAAAGSITWLAAIGGAAGACLAAPWLRGTGASQMRARIGLLAVLQVAAAALGFFLAARRWSP